MSDVRNLLAELRHTERAYYFECLFIVNLRINEPLQIGRCCFQLRRFNLPRHLCGAVFNRTYRGQKC